MTGKRWKDDAPFDAEGRGTSDLDLTLVGHRILEYYKITGFFVPGVHSRPLSDEDPEIAPELTPPTSVRRARGDLSVLAATGPLADTVLAHVQAVVEREGSIALNAALISRNAIGE